MIEVVTESFVQENFFVEKNKLAVKNKLILKNWDKNTKNQADDF